MAETVMTVLGPVTPDALGLADAHSHVWIEPVPGADPAAPVLVDEGLVLAGLQAFARAGGGAIVDCQPSHACGRDVNRLASLSRRSGVHIVACTGFHRRRYYGPEALVWRMNAQQACDHFLAEIRQGLAETRGAACVVHPGFIKIAAEASLAASPRALFEAAAAASRLTGLALEIHTERGAAAEAILSFFQDQAVAAGRMIFCHMDKRPDFGFHRELAQSGALLEYDTFFRPKYHPERHVWPLLANMLEAGLGSQIALATDLAGAELWKAPGPAGLATLLRDRLAAMGVEELMIDRLLGGNVTNRLAHQQTNKDR